jgi:hypothetical protein
MRDLRDAARALRSSPLLSAAATFASRLARLAGASLGSID